MNDAHKGSLVYSQIIHRRKKKPEGENASRVIIGSLIMGWEPADNGAQLSLGGC